jgi:glyoxylase-like metal-dependent hydrolase (beta-lactamase superfamily II)/predicted ester cyclase
MASATEIARRYFAAAANRDVEAMVACWAPGGIERFVGQQEVIAPAGVRDYFNTLFGAFPDFTFEVVDVTTARSRTAVRWRATATFAGPGSFQGIEPGGQRIAIEGCDVLTIVDDLIQRNDAYLDSGDIARQLGLLPPLGSRAEARLARLANLRTRLAARLGGGDAEPVADGVWVVRGGFPARTMNVYLIEDGASESDGSAGVTVFDAGIASMAGAVRRAAARLGGIRRVVLGHADADHRGAAPALSAPVYCHPAEREAAGLPDPYRPYFDFSKLGPHGRFVLSRMLPVWDGGPVEIEGTVAEGSEVAGFRVIELPGHAPGLIGLWRESDRLALASDCVYTIDPQTGIPGHARVPHAAFNIDTELARSSMLKLADMEPASAWFGHARPLRGDVASSLRRAAAVT